MSALVFKACGPMTSLQDAGRIGSGRHGLSRSGAMDRLALAEANALVGNDPREGAIELMLAGASFAVEGGPLRLALAGAAMAVQVDGAPVQPGTSTSVPEGASVTVGPALSGVFGYLAVAGGFAVERQLGSVALQPRAGIGGLDGRPFRAGDRVPARAGGEPGGPEQSLPLSIRDPTTPIRVVLGPQDDFFDTDSIASFLSQTYVISEEADRMGYRLAGTPIAHEKGYNIVSDGIVPGSIQVPGSGLPIVLMADAQTTGGYPKIATVITPDLRLLAQRRTGDGVRFQAVGMAKAQAAARERAAEIAALTARTKAVGSGLPGVEELLALNLAGAATDAFAPIED